IVYYFRRYPVTGKGTVLAFLVGCALTGFVQIVVIQKTVFWASDLDVYFVNKLGLPFFSGFACVYFLIAVGIFVGLRISRWKFLTRGLWCLTFLLIGYSSYLTTLERSNADPAID